jgi:hypothetical protein
VAVRTNAIGDDAAVLDGAARGSDDIPRLESADRRQAWRLMERVQGSALS